MSCAIPRTACPIQSWKQPVDCTTFETRTVSGGSRTKEKPYSGKSLMFLAPIYASTPHLWRPFDQMNVALIYTVTFGLIAIFMASYRLLVRPKSLRAGLLLGLFLGLAVGASVGFGTYIHAPIPLALAWGWFIAGSMKGVAAGAILGALVTEG